MINTSQDFNSALEYVSRELDYSTVKMSNEMNSSTFNYIFTEIEDMLEDIRNYTKEFVLRAIQERRTKIIENLKVIEALSDEVQSKDSTAFVVVPNEGETVYDRNGKQIPCLDNKYGNSVVPGKTLAIDDIIDIVNKGPVDKATVAKEDPIQGDFTAVEYVPLNGAEPFATCSSIVEDNPFHIDIYRSNEPVENFLTVIYDIKFSGKTQSNFINIDPINCKIIDIKLYDIDNNLISVNPDDKYFSLSRVQSASVTVKCQNYDRYLVNMPVNSFKDSFDSSATGGELYE